MVTTSYIGKDVLKQQFERQDCCEDLSTFLLRRSLGLVELCCLQGSCTTLSCKRTCCLSCPKSAPASLSVSTLGTEHEGHVCGSPAPALAKKMFVSCKGKHSQLSCQKKIKHRARLVYFTYLHRDFIRACLGLSNQALILYITTGQAQGTNAKTGRYSVCSQCGCRMRQSQLE